MNPNFFLLSRPTEGFSDLRRENDAKTEALLFMIDMLKSVLKEVRCMGLRWLVPRWCQAIVTHSGPTSPISSLALGPLVWSQVPLVTPGSCQALLSAVVPGEQGSQVVSLQETETSTGRIFILLPSCGPLDCAQLSDPTARGSPMF